MKTARPNSQRPYPLWRRLAKIVLWTAMAVVLTVFALVTLTLTMLKPEQLTPLVNRVADRALDRAELTVGRVELSAIKTYPFVRLQVDDLLVINREFSELKADTLLHLPTCADTVLVADKISAELHVPKILLGKFELGDVIVSGFGANVVALDSLRANYDIMPMADESADDDESFGELPDISIRKFAFVDCRPIRYCDVQNDIHAEVRLRTILDKGNEAPLYKLDFSGNLKSPLMSDFFDELPFVLGGDIRWSPSRPMTVSLDDFVMTAAFAQVDFALEADFACEPVINRLQAELQPLAVADLLECVPDSLTKAYGLADLTTDARISVKFRLDSIFNLATDTIPYGLVTLNVDDCKAGFGRARLDLLALDVDAMLRGNNLDAAEVEIKRAEIAGPATDIKLSGNLDHLMSDPHAKLRIDGHSALNRLPTPLMKLIGRRLSGRVRAALNIDGRMSMLDRNNFHRLHIDGTLDANNITWQSADTLMNVYLDGGSLKFNTNRRMRASSSEMLAIGIKADTMSYRDPDMDVRISDLAFGVGALNTGPLADTTIVIPVGGGVKFKSLTFRSDSDSLGIRLRDVDGRVAVRRYNDMKRVPEIDLDLGVKRMGAWMPDFAAFFSESALKISARKTVAQPRRALNDSLRARRRVPNKGQFVAVDSTMELIDWGEARALGKLLMTWQIDASLTSKRASMSTPYFPIHNRLADINVRFDGDSLVVDNLRYRVGRSDFKIYGAVSNIKRSLTARRRLSPIKIDFRTTSDTIDVNQIAEAFFRGASYTPAAGRNKSNFDLSTLDNDRNFERAIDADDDVVAADTMGPLLIPANIEADIKLRGRNVYYSNLHLDNLAGSIHVKDGAVNMRRLKASSDAGSVDLSALYSAPNVNDMQFGFGLKVDRFDIGRFMELVPALDSIMPIMHDFDGLIDANLAATVDIDRNMDLKLPTLTALIQLRGDSLTLIDADTYKLMAKWLMFKNKQRNIIDHMSVDVVISDNMMQVYPFVFGIDRYHLGVQGNNDLAMNFNYLVSVLKSPLPFKFGITIKGNPDDFKIRVGKAKFDEKKANERAFMADTARVNLINQLENVFRRGVSQSQVERIKVPKVKPEVSEIELDSNLSAADSTAFIQEGLIEAPKIETPEPTKKSKKSKR